MRAAESARPDRLFEDPYAQAFVAAGAQSQAAAIGEATADTSSSPQPEQGVPEPGSLRALMAYQTVIRTRFYDDYLLDACDRGIRQIVLLAAGMDTRAYRLGWPVGLRLYEVDLPSVLEFKDDVMSGADAVTACTRVSCPADLREDWPSALTEAGFAPGEPTAWLAEGLLIYLTAEEAAELLTRIGDLSAPGSRLACERGDGIDWLREQAKEVPALSRAVGLWKGGLGDDTGGWLEGNGWSVEQHDLSSLAESYGRTPPTASRSGFLVATREGDKPEESAVEVSGASDASAADESNLPD
ncbi:SAM-dependent methyltransferase [Actinomadura barringtoniae]|uniref:S-adenosyl-L-methionine-dependent methyltransferase n=2 Tax=Actinomadura barringtoniae TaxID=1427535 RepID=A0A939P7N2_9ACTN|nr:SAM-dependent methyltransferase [Actinomadura barringtoniae]